MDTYMHPYIHIPPTFLVYVFAFYTTYLYTRREMLIRPARIVSLSRVYIFISQDIANRNRSER